MLPQGVSVYPVIDEDRNETIFYLRTSRSHAEMTLKELRDFGVACITLAAIKTKGDLP